MLKSAICEMLNIKYPVFQGGMAHIADASLAAAVSNGGGLGIISAMNSGTDYLKEQIDRARELTDKPFGVNVMLMSPHVEEVASLLAEEKVSVITTGAGNPEKYMNMWLSAGIKVIPVVASTALAKMVERQGASAIIAEGGESGGHVGDMTTMALVPQVCDSVSIPRYRRRRHSGRTGNGGFVYAWRMWRSDGHALLGCRRVHRSRKL